MKKLRVMIMLVVVTMIINMVYKKDNDYENSIMAEGEEKKLLYGLLEE